MSKLAFFLKGGCIFLVYGHLNRVGCLLSVSLRGEPAFYLRLRCRLLPSVRPACPDVYFYHIFGIYRVHTYIKKKEKKLRAIRGKIECKQTMIDEFELGKDDIL